MTNRIRQWRKRRKLTLEKLFDQLGTSAGHLHKWETGKVAITVDRLQEVANAREMEDVSLLWAAPVLDARPTDEDGK